MTGTAIVFMALVCCFVWGGFVLLLRRAILCERRKTESE